MAGGPGGPFVEADGGPGPGRAGRRGRPGQVVATLGAKGCRPFVSVGAAGSSTRGPPIPREVPWGRATAGSPFLNPEAVMKEDIRVTGRAAEILGTPVKVRHFAEHAVAAARHYPVRPF